MVWHAHARQLILQSSSYSRGLLSGKHLMSWCCAWRLQLMYAFCAVGPPMEHLGLA
jgi:hypothetical protein